MSWKSAIFEASDEKTTETTIEYVIREYNHLKGEVMGQVKNECKWKSVELKENQEYVVTISAMKCDTNETTEESWPVVFKTPVFMQGSAIGIVRYEIEFSEHYHKTSEQSHMCQQVWMPLTPSPNNYTLRVHTICEFNQETHRSLPSPVLSVPAEF
ncbi:hypothetical protein RFI_34732, partial [Reticulomyxa filosa]